MSMLSNVKRGRIIKPILVVVYGPGGIGKSTWGANAPDPIFLGAEEGTDLLDVARLPTPKNLDDVNQALKELLEEEHSYKTLVVDSLDWIEPLIYSAVCKRYGKASIELAAGGYGKGYTEACDEWVKLLEKFAHLRDTRKMNIILLAHPEIKTTTNPQTQATYQKYELKLHKQSKAKIMEFVDAIFFATFEMLSSRVGEEIKSVSTKKRVLQGVPNEYDGFDAKNRYGLKDPVPMSLAWDEFISLCNLSPIEVVRANIEQLLPLVADQDIQEKAREAYKNAGDEVGTLVKILTRLRTLIIK